MQENIIAKLTSKDDKCACSVADKIMSERIAMGTEVILSSFKEE